MLLPSLRAVALSMSLGLSAQAAPAPDGSDWIAPADESHAEGTYGVTFLPRYGPDDDPWARSQQDRAELAQALVSMSAEERADATRLIDARLRAVHAWTGRLTTQMRGVEPGSPAATRLQDALDRLSWEARTLEQQRLLLAGSGASASPPPAGPDEAPPTAPVLEVPAPPVPPTPPLPPQATMDITWGPDQDVQVVGRSLRVPPGEKARSVTVVAGNLSVHGHILGTATVLGGDILMHPGGRIDGETVTLGGSMQDVQRDGSVVIIRKDLGDQIDQELRQLEDLGDLLQEEHLEERIEEELELPFDPRGVEPPESSPQASASGSGHVILGLLGRATLLLATFGLCMLAQALLPAHIERAGDEVADRPGFSFLMGFLASLATASVSGFLFLTCVGIPLATLLLGALGALLFLGVMAVATRAVPSWSFLSPGQGQKVTWLAIALLAALAPTVPWLAVPVLLLTGITGAGAWILTRLGQDRTSPR